MIGGMEFSFGTSSGNSSRVAFGLYESGLAHVAHRLDVPAGDSRTADYLALNPMGKVPVLVEGSMRLWESNAINWYLAEDHPAPDCCRRQPRAEHRCSAGCSSRRDTSPPRASLYFVSGTGACKSSGASRVTSVPRGRREGAGPLSARAGSRAGAHEWLEPHFSLADIAYAPHLWLIAEGGFDSPLLRARVARSPAGPARMAKSGGAGLRRLSGVSAADSGRRRRTGRRRCTSCRKRRSVRHRPAPRAWPRPARRATPRCVGARLSPTESRIVARDGLQHGR